MYQICQGQINKKTFQCHIKVYSLKQNTEVPPKKKFVKNSSTEPVQEQRPQCISFTEHDWVDASVL